MNIAVGIAESNHFAAKLGSFLRSKDGHVTRAGDHYRFAIKALALHGFEHFRRQIAKAVAGCLRPNQRAAKGQALPGEDTGIIAAPDAAVLAEHIADLTPPHADVTGRDIHELANVTVQLRHEALTKTHHLSVTLTFGIKVRTAFGTAHGKTG